MLYIYTYSRFSSVKQKSYKVSNGADENQAPQNTASDQAPHYVLKKCTLKFKRGSAVAQW